LDFERNSETFHALRMLKKNDDLQQSTLHISQTENAQLVGKTLALDSQRLECALKCISLDQASLGDGVKRELDELADLGAYLELRDLRPSR
jgi:hypothetical protein